MLSSCKRLTMIYDQGSTLVPDQYCTNATLKKEARWLTTKLLNEK